MPPLLAHVDRQAALDGVIIKVLRVQEHMLAYLDGTLPWDPDEACAALHHLGDDAAIGWNSLARRFAAALGHTLPPTAPEGRVTLPEVAFVVQQREIDRVMANPQILWEPRPSMSGWQQGRVGQAVVVYLEVGAKICWLRWNDLNHGEVGWMTKHGSEGAAKLAAERRIGSRNASVR